MRAVVLKPTYNAMRRKRCFTAAVASGSPPIRKAMETWPSA